ncbi:MarR family transcriptional regulator [Streptomyces sp. NPDC004266]|uniref:MarR family transcriptional regulator n=1 Tax=Streptomyces sp. NPDC004266 TaxID=3364693 RepID=UPI0036830D7C
MIPRDPEARLRDLAAGCGVTERAVRAVVSDLEGAGCLTRSRHGRRNHHQVARHAFFRHPAEARYEIDCLPTLPRPTPPDAGKRRAAGAGRRPAGLVPGDDREA